MPRRFAVLPGGSLSQLVCEQGQASDTQGGLSEKQRAGDPEEMAAVAGFEDVGEVEDASDEAEE